MKMIKLNKIDPRSISYYELDGIAVQTILTSQQIQCDLVKQYNIWVPKAQEFAGKLTPSRKFRVILMDPPYNNTGCKLGYQTMDDKEWFEVLNFDELIDDGLIFIWVTNAKLGVIITHMQLRGWTYWENFCWNKYDQ
jgi:16S rRNA G966 N2-methylase RsmD